MTYTPPSQSPAPGPEYLAATRFFDCDAPALRSFAEHATAGARTDVEKAVKLYYAVRDRWRYDPFSMRLAPQAYVASNVLTKAAAYCIPKAILLVALARAAGIPTAFGSSDVVNHLSTEKLKKRMGGKSLFIHHGYAVMYLEDKWIKAAPAFNVELCQRFGVAPTEFDGASHAILQPYDALNRRHMEYVKDHGTWSEFPHDLVMRDLQAFYPESCFVDWLDEEEFAPR
jgi:transglutaminase-like putative cysteine protease